LKTFTTSVLICSLILSGIVASSTSAHAQATPVPSETGRSYNTRKLRIAQPSFNGVTSTYNNGTSNLSAPTPVTNGIGLESAQASFNTWVVMEDVEQLPSAPCYAELNVVKRVSSGLGATLGFPSFTGRIYATTIWDGEQGRTRQKQYPGTTGAVPNGGSTAEMTITPAGSLAAKFNGATVLTLNGVKCQGSGGVLYTPGGFVQVDRGFEGNTTASVWTNGSSIGQAKQKFGVGGSYTASPVLPTIQKTYASWSTTYNPNDNGGTIVMYR
jgi:hypothetical protein